MTAKTISVLEFDKIKQRKIIIMDIIQKWHNKNSQPILFYNDLQCLQDLTQNSFYL